MDHDRWKTVNTIFHAALDVSSNERVAFVRQASNGDSDLQVEVARLLQADEDAGSYLESPLLACAPFMGPISQVKPGDILCSRFRVLRVIGEGGMGQVFEALDTELAVHVALKTIRSDVASNPEALARFRQEVRLARRITHPNVCRTFDLERDIRAADTTSGTMQEVVFLSMEFLEGETLDARIKRTGSLSLGEAQEIARQVAEALVAAHALGIVHRDMKPANIMLTPGSDQIAEGIRAVIMDFGLARTDHVVSSGNLSGLSQTSRPIGTFAYMAPEQLENAPVSSATDVYAFGLILFEMVTGERAFPSDNFLMSVAQRLSGPAPSPQAIVPSLPIPWCRAIEGCLHLKPSNRFQSAADVAAILDGANTVLPRANNQRLLHSHTLSTKFSSTPLRARFVSLVITLFATAILAAFVARMINDRSNRAKQLSDGDTVVLADYSNRTGETVFDGTLKTALAVSLNQSPFLNILQDDKVSETMQLMERPVALQLTPELAREVCLRAGSKAYISGSIAQLGTQYVLGLKAVNCQSGELLDQEQITTGGKEKVLTALGTIASIMRVKLGESLGSIQKYDVPLVAATTPSLEALRALSLGRKIDLQDSSLASRYFMDAVELDPTFALAYHDLGRLNLSLGELERARTYYKKAFELRDHSSEREKLEIAAGYYENVTGELDKAIDIRKEQIAAYPKLSAPHQDLAIEYALLGRYELAITAFRQSIELGSESPSTYGLLANVLIGDQQFEDARRLIREARARNIDAYLLHNALFGLAFIESDSGAEANEEGWLQNQPQYEHFGYSLRSDSEAYIGHLRNARDWTRRSVNSAVRSGSKEGGAVWAENAAVREAVFGNPREAERAAGDGIQISPTSLAVREEAALAYAIARDNSRAASLTTELDRHFPNNTQLQLIWLPAVRAQIALNENDPSAAIEELQASRPVEFGLVPFNTNISCLYNIYIRGNAYLEAGAGDRAAEEFQKILDHRGVVWNCSTGSLAQLGLARAYVLQAMVARHSQSDGLRARALSAYSAFLAIWKDSDQDIPVFRQGKIEYSQLLRGRVDRLNFGNPIKQDHRNRVGAN